MMEVGSMTRPMAMAFLWTSITLSMRDIGWLTSSTAKELRLGESLEASKQPTSGTSSKERRMEEDDLIGKMGHIMREILLTAISRDSVGIISLT